MKTDDMTREQLMSEYHKLVKEKDDCAKKQTVLRSSDEKLRFILDSSPIGLSITNVKGDVLFANKILQDLLGYTADDLKKIDLSEIYADPGERRRILEMLQKSDIVRDFETKLKKKNGELQTVFMNTNIVDYEDQKVMLTSIHEVTQLADMEKSLKASEEQYHFLFSNAPVGITVTSFQGKISASNQAMQELMGYSQEELKVISIRDFYVDPDERERLLALTRKTGMVRDFETKYRRKDGEVITVLINTDLVNFEGEQNLLLTSIRNISRLKRVEEELTQERDLTNGILNTAASLILVIDHEGRIIRFNYACEKTSGYSFRDVYGKYIWETLSGDPVITRNMVRQLLDGSYPSTHENSWVTKNGDKRLISWSSTVLNGNEGKAEYIIATGIDITEKRQAETKLQEANQKLALWVSELEERTADMKLLSEMGEQLQSCQNTNEACMISVQFIQKIYPASHGALYLINPSKDLAEAVEMWGEPAYTEKMFLPLNCWAVRRSRMHLVDREHPGLRCAHIDGPADGQYLCLPMMTQGEMLGVLHLNNISAEGEQKDPYPESYSDQKLQLLMSVAEHIVLALSNLKLRETLRQQSIRDVLTGVFNRRYMEETMIREIHRAQRESKPIGVIMLDIDHFKIFNDLSGHDGGDALLRELGVLLNKNTRGGDIACRFGGEEFVVVLIGADLENTRIRAEGLRMGVKDLLVYHLGKPLGKCTISLGVAAYPEHGDNYEALLKSADSALYRAKNEGRDRVIVARDNGQD
jgi:diguanylate cyclase (GGDEF)-like protein/PAS domain S-box-containing protein